ncbi:hypothetical protein [Nocardia sp. NPDC004722]
MTVFFMMFQPWLRASGWDGKGTVDAFGRMQRTSRHLNLWSQAAPPGARITGVWAILATVTIVVVVIAAVQAIRSGSETAGAVTAIATVVLAILILVDVLNLDSHKPLVAASLGMGGDLGPQIGMALDALSGRGSYPWPGKEGPTRPTELTLWSFAAIAVACGSAAVVVIRSWRTTLRAVVAVVAKIA